MKYLTANQNLYKSKPYPPYMFRGWHEFNFEGSHQRCFIRKGVHRNFGKFTGKHLCQSLFFIKVSCSPEACNFIKKETLVLVFSCEFCENCKNTFFTEHLWATASEFYKNAGHGTAKQKWKRNNKATVSTFDILYY